MVVSICDSILKFSRNKYKKHMLGIDTDPDWYALDADLNPAK
jgi:hypothetical protein